MGSWIVEDVFEELKSAAGREEEGQGQQEYLTFSYLLLVRFFLYLYIFE